MLPTLLTFIIIPINIFSFSLIYSVISPFFFVVTQIELIPHFSISFVAWFIVLFIHLTSLRAIFHPKYSSVVAPLPHGHTFDRRKK